MNRFNVILIKIPTTFLQKKIPYVSYIIEPEKTPDSPLNPAERVKLTSSPSQTSRHHTIVIKTVWYWH